MPLQTTDGRDPCERCGATIWHDWPASRVFAHQAMAECGQCGAKAHYHPPAQCPAADGTLRRRRGHLYVSYGSAAPLPPPARR